MKKLKEEDLRIRKEYGIKDDEDWFDGRWGIRKQKATNRPLVLDSLLTFFQDN